MVPIAAGNNCQGNCASTAMVASVSGTVKTLLTWCQRVRPSIAPTASARADQAASSAASEIQGKAGWRACNITRCPAAASPSCVAAVSAGDDPSLFTSLIAAAC